MVLGVMTLLKFLSKMCFIITIALHFYLPICYYFIFQLHMCFYKHMNYVAHADSWSSLKILDYYKKILTKG